MPILQRTGFFERSPGNRSMLRLIAFMGTILGSIISLWGMCLVTAGFIAVLNGSLKDAAILGTLFLPVPLGAGLSGGSEIMKAIQQRGEVKEGSV